MRRTTTRLAIALAALTPLVIGTAVAAGPSGGAQHPSLIQPIQIAGRYGVPDDAAMIAANVTAVNPADNGFITVWPCDEDRPDTSNVNYLANQVAPNLVLSKLSADGLICVSTLAISDVIIDLVGYVPAGSSVTPLPTAVRFVDTRDDGGTVLAGQSLTVPVAGISGVAGDAGLVMFNATAIAGPEPGFLSVYPCGEPVPDTSSVNYLPGQIVPNLVTSRIGTDGSVCIFTLADADIIVDVAAYANAGIEPLDNPVRVIDTRDRGIPQRARDTMSLDITSRADVPDDATAAVYNLTSVNSTAPGFATSYPCDVGLPDVSNLNYGPGQVVANGAITKLSRSGRLCLYTLSETDLIVDLIGYTTGDADYVPIAPVRIRDTRDGWQRTCDWIIVATGTFSGSVRLFNVDTREVLELTGPSGPFEPAASPTIGSSCESVLYFLDETGGAAAGAHELFFDGSRTFLPVPTELEFSFIRSIHEFGDLLMIGSESGALYDASTGDVIWEGASTPEAVLGIEAAANGIVALTYLTPDASATTIEVWDVPADELLSRIEIVGGSTDVSLSSDGRYLAARDGDITVFTLFGDVVDVVRAPIDLRASFAGTGALLLCAEFNGIFSWDLFGPIEQLIEWDELVRIAGTPNCEVTS